MGLAFKIAVLQFNATVGAISHNCAGLFAAYERAVKMGADLVVAPEFCVTGYPLEDLVLRESFLKAVGVEVNTLIEKILDSGHKAAFVFGAPKTINNPPYHREFIYNAAFFIDPADEDIRTVYKQKLPNYGVFDEKRTFMPGLNGGGGAIDWRGITFGLMICEDGWSRDVASRLTDQGADMLISINGSPFEMEKIVTRHRIVQNRIAETGLPFLYVNAVGGQDELVFDGGSFFYAKNGTVFEAPRFEEGIYMFDADIDRVVSIVSAREKNPGLTDPIKIYLGTDGSGDEYIPIQQPNVHEETYQALVLGVRDYLRKQNFKSVVLGYSGGVDSGLVAAIACDAIGSENVHLVRLPSAFSSQGSLDDAAEGAKRLGAHMRTIDIEPIVASMREGYRRAWIDGLEDTSKDQDMPWWKKPLTGTSDENLQARARGTIMMAISNQEGHVVLTTGNKSEFSVGYCTLYGDMNGGYNPLKDVYKTVVWQLCRWRNSLTDTAQLASYGFHGPAGVVVPEEIINKPPSAELRENQQDSDSLPPYPVLDFILENMIEKEKGVGEIVALMRPGDYAPYESEVARIRNLIDQAEYKRRQAAPGVKVTAKIHGRDRRYPIVNHWRK